MENNLFREKNLKSISSPDSLNDYIRVVTPSVWVTLIAVVVLLIGVTIWGAVGHLDTVVKAVVVSDDSGICAYVGEKDAPGVLNVSTIIINGTAYTYDNGTTSSTLLTVKEDEMALTILGYDEDTKVRCLSVEGNLPAGTYEGRITVDAVKPISFIVD